MSNETKDTKSLEAELAKANKRAEQAEARALKAEKAAGSVDTLKGQVKDLHKRLEAQESTAPKNAKPLVELDGEYYQVVAGERSKKGLVTAAELAKDTARCKELLAMGSGLLRKAKKKK